jgi:Trypsin-like peptidase domain
MKSLNPNNLSFVPILLTMYFDETRQKLATGTGFIYKFNGKFYLITNWHNVTGLNPITKQNLASHGGLPDVMTLTLLISDKPLKWENFTINLYENNKADWYVHPIHKQKVDVVAIEIEIPENFSGIIKPVNEITYNDFDIEIADDVYVLGYPLSITGGGYFPIWKRGSVATEPEIDYEGLPKFLIDTATKKGMSGSPVIFRRNGLQNKTENKISLDSILGVIQDFVGIYSGRIASGESSNMTKCNCPKCNCIDCKVVNYDFDSQLGIVWKKEVIEEIIKGNLKDEKNFA